MHWESSMRKGTPYGPRFSGYLVKRSLLNLKQSGFLCIGRGTKHEIFVGTGRVWDRRLAEAEQHRLDDEHKCFCCLATLLYFVHGDT